MPGQLDVGLGPAALAALLVGLAVVSLYVSGADVLLGFVLGNEGSIKMKGRVDILWGLAALAVTVGHHFLPYWTLLRDQYPRALMLCDSWLLPAMWVICIYFMVKKRKRSLWFFWWVWLSSPFVFSDLMFDWVMFWVTTGAIRMV
ncbi:MAG: hypothetical protein AB1814_10150 [Thermodesulfobacteriota bacterium]